MTYLFQRLRKKSVGIFLVLLLTGLSWSSVLDDISLEQTNAALKRALVTFAVARALNSVISVAQGTEIAVEPAGFGVNFAPGQMLDPLNDLVEQFSWIMLASAVSLGIQKIFLEISSSYVACWLLTVLVVCYVIVNLRKTSDGTGLSHVLNLSLVVMLFLRFSVPMVVFMGNCIYQEFLADDYEQSRQILETTQQNLLELNKQEHVEGIAQSNQTLVDKAKHMINSAVAAMDVEARLEQYKKVATAATERTVDLIVVFILQTILLPILFLWFCYHLAARLLGLPLGFFGGADKELGQLAPVKR